MTNGKPSANIIDQCGSEKRVYLCRVVVAVFIYFRIVVKKEKGQISIVTFGFIVKNKESPHYTPTLSLYVYSHDPTFLLYSHVHYITIRHTCITIPHRVLLRYTYTVLSRVHRHHSIIAVLSTTKVT